MTGRPRATLSQQISHRQVPLLWHSCSTTRMNEVNPPQFLPPEGRDAATGAVSLPFEARGVTAYSSCLRGCCWSSRDLYIFGPERLEETSVRTTAQVPESLRALGIDQHEYGSMLEDAKAGLANAAPPIGLCCAGACIFTFVLAPFSMCYLIHLSSPGLGDKLIERGANRVEKATSARASRWRAVYGVETKLVRDVRYKRPRMPAGDVGVTRLEARSPHLSPHDGCWESSEWVGSALTFTPPSAASMQRGI